MPDAENPVYPLPETRAAALRSADNLQQLRQQAQPVSASVRLPGQPELLWQVLAANDFLNQAVGMQSTRNAYLARPYGSTWMHCSTKNGGLPVAYEEMPYEWLAPHYYKVERIHSKGPLKYLAFGVQLSSAGPQESDVTCTIDFVAHLPAAVARLLIRKEIQRFIKTFRQLADRLAAGTPVLKAFFDARPAQQAALHALSQRWQTLLPSADIASALADYIYRAPERLAYRLRPFELAEAYALDPLEVLKDCLLLSREGDLHLLWDCRCPGCKGPKESVKNLQNIKAVAYCETCAVSYGLAFDQNLELSFQPSARLRPTQERFFCAGSPCNTPHISWQQNLLPGETRNFVIDLPPGPYILRSLACSREILLQIQTADASAQTRLAIAADFVLNDQPEAETLNLLQGGQLQVHNGRSHELSLMLENPAWQSQAVTAARAQSLQAFQDLFPQEVLAPHEALPLQNQIFVRAEILNPEQLQEPEAPDSLPAVQQELLDWLKQHFQAHEGAACPLTENSLLGLFASPFEALSAAWSISQELPLLGLLYNAAPQLALAVVQGPCEVFAQGQQLAYRGLALEQSREALAHADGQRLVVGTDLLQSPEMRLFLEDPLATWERLTDTSDCGADWIAFQFDNLLTEFL
ncbi:MAG: hypothetical protein IGS03_12675 [Candidatus Sericytochromatia bacterium]|nr:hypothetical protein [Candidatus Sericytochromatia bacterium]